MLSDNKIATFLKDLIGKSRKGYVHWEATPPANQGFEADEEATGLCYFTQFGPQRLRLTQVRYKYWRDVDDWEWSSLIALDFVDGRGRLLWRFPSSAEIRELFEIVQFRTSGVEDAIDSFLSEQFVPNAQDDS